MIVANEYSGGGCAIGSYASVGAAVRDLLGLWCESPGPFVIILTDEATGRPVGTMLATGDGHALVCIANGVMRKYRVWYELDEAGRYVRTVVKRARERPTIRVEAVDRLALANAAATAN